MIKKNIFINSSFILLIFLLDRISKIYVIYLDKKFLGSEIFSSKSLEISSKLNLSNDEKEHVTECFYKRKLIQF